MNADLIDRYAVFGNPIEHSKSPLIHGLFAEETKQNVQYSKQLVELDGFKKATSSFFKEGGKGLNVTVPFKLDAFNFSQQLSERAQKAGAVNTLCLNKDKSGDNVVCGDNTDGCGLVRDITNNLDWEIKNKNILILGAGGAVHGVLQPLLEQNPQKIIIANRTVSKAEQLANLFGSQILACKYDSLEEQNKTQTVDLIINGTSASLSGELPTIPETLIHPGVACYDMMYGKELTVFLQWAKQQGCQNISDGLGMLVEQAAESFTIWRGVTPNTKNVIKRLRENL